MKKKRQVVMTELLFVIQNKHGSMPSLNLENILVSFYNEGVKASKIIIYEFAHSFDIVQLYNLLDHKRVSFRSSLVLI